MEDRIILSDTARADDPDRDDAREDKVHEVWPDLAYRRTAIVNVALFGEPGCGDRGWVLIDGGFLNAASLIKDAAERRFGKNARAAAIILTHGHADHVAAIEDLAEEWDVPVYAHHYELPYLNGTSSYPKTDPGVGGGMMALTSPTLPRGPFDFSRWLQPLPDDGTVPFMPDWKWIHTPGHTPGHVSLWRESDRSLIAGDAVVTTDQESIYAAITQKHELQGPPMYFTQNWQDAAESVRKIAGLQPDLLLTGHGRAMQGQEMRDGLNRLARDFWELAVPKDGEYVKHPASVQDGSAYVS